MHHCMMDLCIHTHADTQTNTHTHKHKRESRARTIQSEPSAATAKRGSRSLACCTSSCAHMDRDHTELILTLSHDVNTLLPSRSLQQTEGACAHLGVPCARRASTSTSGQSLVYMTDNAHARLSVRTSSHVRRVYASG